MGTKGLNRRILALAVPAFAALVAQPLFLLADTAIVGRLGTLPLAGLGAGATITSTVVGLAIFLAYGSTAVVSRQLGGGNRRRALELGVQAMWLALALAVAVGWLVWLAAPQLVGWLGATGEVHGHAVAYARWSLPGLPGMLLMLAATGTLRGLADARTPLVLAVSAAGINVVLDLVFVFGLHMGVAGSGFATAVAETLMGTTAALVVARGARREGASLRPSLAGMRSSLKVGAPLLMRTLTLRLALVLTTWVAANKGAVALAGHQVTYNVWGFLSYALDALGIAGQTLIGMALGAGDVDEARAVTRRMLWWSLGAGVALGLLTILARQPIAALFSPEVEVRNAVAASLVVVGATLTLTAYVCLMDGVLIGAGDGPFLARAGVFTLVVYAPLAVLVAFVGPDGGAGLAWLWVAYGVAFMGARALTLWLRQRGGAWLVTGA
ncbi:MATE family efflux transporter [Tessaracoccus rhinocerotis]|uniref:MATE family efflux transporter n=1 Tax=Tessaracoccus rhinocerotis TaxID=1689449 RepID=A0A553K6J2_9ACTN|nr:MATE family efflux transporter [Tessaracoccus rhinocerotis]TRY20333.1 MATE family efflux transporter [Tessaracoccus rhinocerotis]